MFGFGGSGFGGGPTRKKSESRRACFPMGFCVNCGLTTPPSGRFCPSCGASVEGNLGMSSSNSFLASSNSSSEYVHCDGKDGKEDDDEFMKRPTHLLRQLSGSATLESDYELAKRVAQQETFHESFRRNSDGLGAEPKARDRDAESLALAKRLQEEEEALRRERRQQSELTRSDSELARRLSATSGAQEREDVEFALKLQDENDSMLPPAVSASSGASTAHDNDNHNHNHNDNDNDRREFHRSGDSDLARELSEQALVEDAERLSRCLEEEEREFSLLKERSIREEAERITALQRREEADLEIAVRLNKEEQDKRKPPRQHLLEVRSDSDVAKKMQEEEEARMASIQLAREMMWKATLVTAPDITTEKASGVTAMTSADLALFGDDKGAKLVPALDEQSNLLSSFAATVTPISKEGRLLPNSFRTHKNALFLYADNKFTAKFTPFQSALNSTENSHGKFIKNDGKTIELIWDSTWSTKLRLESSGAFAGTHSKSGVELLASRCSVMLLKEDNEDE